jgi:hypothetical protein
MKMYMTGAYVLDGHRLRKLKFFRLDFHRRLMTRQASLDPHIHFHFHRASRERQSSFIKAKGVIIM